MHIHTIKAMITTNTEIMGQGSNCDLNSKSISKSKGQDIYSECEMKKIIQINVITSLEGIYSLFYHNKMINI